MANKIPLIKTISGKQVIWFQNSNNYVLTNQLEADVVLKLSEGKYRSEILESCSSEMNISHEQADNFICSVEKMIEQQDQINVNKTSNYKNHYNSLLTTDFSIRHYYKVFDRVVKVEYESSELEFLIHPKFAHLKTESDEDYCNHFKIFSDNDLFVLEVDGHIIGQWVQDNLHYLSGKFSMEFLNKIYNKNENDWLGVFHASAITDGKNSLMFVGNSGSGKSTICSILMSNGFDLIADDFVPLNKLTKISSFPAALSIKKSAWNDLNKLFPDLNNEFEYHNQHQQKIVKYLPPKSYSYGESFNVKALIFVKYQPDISCDLQKIDKDEAFQELIPDSWLSPTRKNAEKFLDWYIKLPCYRLTYSDNEAMLSSINNLFEDEV